MNERTYKPTVLHTSINGISYLCGDKRTGSWHDRCMTDKFARSLPLCKDCEEVKNQRFGVDTEAPPKVEPIEWVQTSGTGLSDTRTVVSDYRRDA